MLNFAEQTGSGAVMLVWSFPSPAKFVANLKYLQKNETNNKLVKRTYLLRTVFFLYIISGNAWEMGNLEISTWVQSRSQQNYVQRGVRKPKANSEIEKVIRKLYFCLRNGLRSRERESHGSFYIRLFETTESLVSPTNEGVDLHQDEKRPS